MRDAKSEQISDTVDCRRPFLRWVLRSRFSGLHIISFYNSRSVHNQCLGWVLSTQRYKPSGMTDTTNRTHFRWFIALRSKHRLQTVSWHQPPYYLVLESPPLGAIFKILRPRGGGFLKNQLRDRFQNCNQFLSAADNRILDFLLKVPLGISRKAPLMPSEQIPDIDCRRPTTTEVRNLFRFHTHGTRNYVSNFSSTFLCVMFG
jgi:hypothetical protein